MEVYSLQSEQSMGKHSYFSYFIILLFCLNTLAQEDIQLEVASQPTKKEIIVKALTKCTNHIKQQEDKFKELKNLEQSVQQLRSGSSSLEVYREARKHWRRLTELVYSIGALDKDQLEKAYQSQLQGLQEQGATKGNLLEAKEKYDSCLEQINSNEVKLRNLAIGNFIMTSRLRSREIQYQRQLETTPIFRWTDEFFNDHLREIKVIPLRWVAIFTSKKNRFQEDLAAGVEGWIRVATDLFLLLLFLASLIFFIIFSLKFTKFAEKYRAAISRALFANNSFVNFGIWFQRFYPYIPWVLLILFVRLEAQLIQDTYFSDLKILFPYIVYYAAYQIVNILLSQVLFSYLSFSRKYDFAKLRDKVRQSAKRFSKFVIWSLVLLHTAESAVGRGFIYIWIINIFYIGLAYIIISESRKWEHEIEDMIKSVAPDRYYNLLIGIANRSYFLRSLLLLCFSLVFYIFTVLYRWVKNLEISKTISARVFRERVKQAAKSEKATEVSIRQETDYRQKFEAQKSEIVIHGLETTQNHINEYIKKWQQGECNRRNIGIIGELGSGKTSFLEKLNFNNQEVNYKSFCFKNRSKAQDVFKEIEASLKETKNHSVYLIDNAHFLFLTNVGGFEWIKKFLTMLDKSPDHISWVVTFNINSWTYLNAVMSKTRYFADVYPMAKWTEAEIKALIMHHHKATEYVVSFDKILMAMKSDNVYEAQKYVEEKYFRILWEESRGNPDIAMELWIRSLRRSGRPKHFSVGIPQSRYEKIEDLPNEFYFILASIVWHGHISLKELCMATDSEIDFVRNVLEVCEDKGLVVKRGGLWRISRLWLNNVIITLTGKNYIHAR